ncbi:MAG: hypothetical protein DCC67_18270 [Planctomycetota bacterium]|nr:MAG: hypothetical protein DCC67_18270 [Planctomycetota bacterium]
MDQRGGEMVGAQLRGNDVRSVYRTMTAAQLSPAGGGSGAQAAGQRPAGAKGLEAGGWRLDAGTEAGGWRRAIAALCPLPSALCPLPSAL